MGGKFTTVEGLLQDVMLLLVSLSLSICLPGREVYHSGGLAAGCEETGWFLSPYLSVSLGGKFTTVEGLLQDVKTQVGFFLSVCLSGREVYHGGGLLQDVKRQVGFYLFCF